MDLMQCINNISQLNEQEKVKALKLVFKILNNILNDPTNIKYHDLNANAVCNKLKECSIFIELLLSAGFYKSDDGQRFLFDSKRINQLKLVNNFLLYITSPSYKNQQQKPKQKLIPKGIVYVGVSNDRESLIIHYNHQQVAIKCIKDHRLTEYNHSICKELYGKFELERFSDYKNIPLRWENDKGYSACNGIGWLELTEYYMIEPIRIRIKIDDSKEEVIDYQFLTDNLIDKFVKYCKYIPSDTYMTFDNIQKKQYNVSIPSPYEGSIFPPSATKIGLENNCVIHINHQDVHESYSMHIQQDYGGSKGESFEIEVNAEWTILDIKVIIQKIKHISYSNQRLIFKGRCLLDHNKLYECNSMQSFRDETVYMIWTSRGS